MFNKLILIAAAIILVSGCSSEPDMAELAPAPEALPEIVQYQEAGFSDDVQKSLEAELLFSCEEELLAYKDELASLQTFIIALDEKSEDYAYYLEALDYIQFQIEQLEEDGCI